jgi:hypothetical protein
LRERSCVPEKVPFSLKNRPLTLLLFQLSTVIVETAEVGKKLLQNGRLARRTMFMPLDKMQGFVVSNDKLQVTESVYRTYALKQIDIMVPNLPDKLPGTNLYYGIFHQEIIIIIFVKNLIFLKFQIISKRIYGVSKF